MITIPVTEGRRAADIIRDIQASMASAIHSGAGVNVEVTMRGDATRWTISGEPQRAEKAAKWVIKTGLMQLDEDLAAETCVDGMFDFEIEPSTFYYLRSN